MWVWRMEVGKDTKITPLFNIGDNTLSPLLPLPCVVRMKLPSTYLFHLLHSSCGQCSSLVLMESNFPITKLPGCILLSQVMMTDFQVDDVDTFLFLGKGIRNLPTTRRNYVQSRRDLPALDLFLDPPRDLPPNPSRLSVPPD